MQKSYEEFLRDLGISESSGRYDVKNKFGYLGKYQLGEQALVAAGYYKPKKEYNNNWNGEFTGKDGVNSVEDFLNNKKAQDNAIQNFQRSQWQEYKNRKDDSYVGKSVKNQVVTPSGLLASSHLKGTSSVDLYLRNNGNISDKVRCDANGTCIEDYMKKFSDYDVSPITHPQGTSKQSQTQKNASKSSSQQLPQNSQKDILRNMVNPMARFESNSIMNKQRGKSFATGYASPVENTFTPEQIGSMSSAEFTQNEPVIMNQLQQGLIGNPEIDLSNKYSGYTNPVSGDSRIFSAEEIGNLSGTEFTQLEPAINAQWGSIGIPTRNELSNAVGSGIAVYVEGYTRSDGTEVKGYYRSR